MDTLFKFLLSTSVLELDQSSQGFLVFSPPHGHIKNIMSRVSYNLVYLFLLRYHFQDSISEGTTYSTF